MLLKVQVFEDGGRWWAAGIGLSVFTSADTLDGLLPRLEQEVARHFQDELEDGAGVELLVLYEKTLRRNPQSPPHTEAE
jgi:hypothetical protein